jgi:hypothetical protein
MDPHLYGSPYGTPFGTMGGPFWPNMSFMPSGPYNQPHFGMGPHYGFGPSPYGIRGHHSQFIRPPTPVIDRCHDIPVARHRDCRQRSKKAKHNAMGSVSQYGSEQVSTQVRQKSLDLSRDKNPVMAKPVSRVQHVNSSPALSDESEYMEIVNSELDSEEDLCIASGRQVPHKRLLPPSPSRKSKRQCCDQNISLDIVSEDEEMVDPEEPDTSRRAHTLSWLQKDVSKTIGEYVKDPFSVHNPTSNDAPGQDEDVAFQDASKFRISRLMGFATNHAVNVLAGGRKNWGSKAGLKWQCRGDDPSSLEISSQAIHPGKIVSHGLMPFMQSAEKDLPFQSFSVLKDMDDSLKKELPADPSYKSHNKDYPILKKDSQFAIFEQATTNAFLALNGVSLLFEAIDNLTCRKVRVDEERPNAGMKREILEEFDPQDYANFMDGMAHCLKNCATQIACLRMNQVALARDSCLQDRELSLMDRQNLRNAPPSKDSILNKDVTRAVVKKLTERHQAEHLHYTAQLYAGTRQMPSGSKSRGGGNSGRSGRGGNKARGQSRPQAQANNSEKQKKTMYKTRGRGGRGGRGRGYSKSTTTGGTAVKTAQGDSSNPPS